MPRKLFIAGLILVLAVGCVQRAAKPTVLTGTTETRPTPAATAPTAVTPTAPRAANPTFTDWTAFLGPFGNGVCPEKGITAPWPKEGLRIVWQMEAAGGYAVPSISKGRLFFFDRFADRARLRCLKPDTGEFIWKFDYPTDYDDELGYDNGPRCCPVIDGDLVYIYGAEGMLHCLNVANGEVVWKVDTVKEFDVKRNFFGIGSAPVIEGDLLLAMVGGSPADGADAFSGNAKPNGSLLVAFDKRTGKVKWKAGDDLSSYAVPVLATIDGRRWCFVFARSGLVGLDPGNGTVDFHFPWRAPSISSVNAADPVVVGNRVLITECYGPGAALLQVKPGGYEVVWNDKDRGFRDRSLMCHWNTPIYHDGYVYGSSGRHAGEAELRCVELATGKVMWKEPDLSRCSLVMIDGYFLCMAETGTLHLLKINPQKFEEVSRLHFPRNPRKTHLESFPCWAAPVVSHGLMYVLRARDKLVCYELIK